MCLIGETSVINEAKPPNINVYCSPHLQRGYNGVERADSQLPGTAIQTVFAPIARAAKRGIRAFYIIKQFILLLTMTTLNMGIFGFFMYSTVHKIMTTDRPIEIFFLNHAFDHMWSAFGK
jgi:hypothetical protein